MFLSIDHSSGVPIYRQIMEQIRYSIAKGSLKPGDRLPAIRKLSLELKVNPNTITKAYSELEHSKVIETRRGMGTYVSDQKIEISEDGKMEIIQKLIERLAVEAVQLDVDQEELESAIQETLDRFYQKEQEGEIG